MTSGHERPSNRRYQSNLRASQAAETRLRILDAAATRFAQSGYAGTSLADIAQSAGVSLETVKLSGPKRQLLLAAFEHSFAGTEGMESLAAHGPVTEITATPDNAHYLTGIVHFVAESNRRSSLLWATLLSAAASDPELATELASLQRRRHADMLILVDELRKRRIIAESGSREYVADAVSFLLSPEGYNQLVLGAQWSQIDYENWLARSIPLIARSDAAE